MTINERKDVKDIAHHADFIPVSDGGRILEFVPLKDEDVLV